ncbi:dynactin subunit 4 [Scheffersomyces xylosifermentans]|uniref:dynactin subunit 4 n=1 Tax=Scheffersomyces xylosifermentans TaxID=1304137 RepID=UPI00315D7099
MSKIYNDSNIFCPTSTTANIHEASSIEFNQIYHLSILHYCPTCQAPKSSEQCSFNLESKFCSNCLADHTDSRSGYCTKNCFICPRCNVILTITISDHGSGKSFKFRCPYCPFQFQSGINEKPKSLHAIVKFERKENPDLHYQLFRTIQSSLSERKDYYHDKSDLSERMEKTLQLGSKHHHDIEKDPFTIDSNRDGISDIQSLTRNPLLDNNSIHPNQPYQEPKFPIVHPLTSKFSRKCLACNTQLLVPAVNKEAPTINKFIIKFNAIEYMPTLKFAPIEDLTLQFDNQRQLLLNFINPLSSKMAVTIAAPPILSSRFVKPSCRHIVNVTLPVSKFVLGALTSKNVMNGIPTSLLTSETAASRAELVRRVGEAQYAEQTEDLQKLVQKGSNWYTIPISVCVEKNTQEESLPLEDSSVTYDIQIPLYITVGSDLPDSLKSVSNRERLSFGYWNVVKLEGIKFHG